MDSAGNLARIAGFKANITVNGKTVAVSDDAITDQPSSFLALVQTAPAIDAGLVLGSDIRESSTIETLREWLPSSLLLGTTPAKIRASVDGVYFHMTKREDNPATPFTRFEIVKLL